MIKLNKTYLTIYTNNKLNITNFKGDYLLKVTSRANSKLLSLDRFDSLAAARQAAKKYLLIY